MSSARRIVVKIGSALLTRGGQGLDADIIAGWAEQCARNIAQGHRVAIVSSGAIVEGMWRLGWKRRPDTLHELQAAAAVGQMGLVGAWESGFQRHGLHTAQMLFTHEDFSDRRRYLNIRTSLRTLLQVGTVPVVNENDCVATDEIRLGDNDTLAGLVANLMEADELHILTDQTGLHTADPTRDPNAELVRQARSDDPTLDRMAGPGGPLGRGGMATKLTAARFAARSGTVTRIVSGREPEVLVRLVAGEEIGTRLDPGTAPLAARKRWLAGQVQVSGRLILDDGAVRVLREAGRSLLPVGVTRVEGDFARGAIVVCADREGREIARGLVNYGAEDSRSIMGKPSSAIMAQLGFVHEPELIHRDNMVLIDARREEGDGADDASPSPVAP